MPYAICSNLDQSKFLSSGNGLSHPMPNMKVISSPLVISDIMNTKSNVRRLTFFTGQAKGPFGTLRVMGAIESFGCN